MKRLKRNPLKGHPREAETRRAMIAAHFDDAQEVVDLQASELACAVADAWVGVGPWVRHETDLTPKFAKSLDRLELVTRQSALRKVRP